MDIYLKEFLTTGKLGLIKPNLKSSEIIELIGQPDDFGIKNKRTIFKYGNLQLGLYNNNLGFIGLYFDEIWEEPNILNFIDFKPGATTSFIDFKNYLNTQKIPNFIDNQLTFDTQLALEIGLGTSGAYFNSVTRLLQSIQYLKRG